MNQRLKSLLKWIKLNFESIKCQRFKKDVLVLVVNSKWFFYGFK